VYNDNNAIFIDTKKSNNKKRKINCVICNPKVELTLVDVENCKWKCTRCKNDYQILDYGGDIIPEEDSLESSHDDYDDDADNSSLLSAEDEFNNDNDNNESDSIPIPKYMQSHGTTEVVEYREE
jgi:hypothetical protein